MTAWLSALSLVVMALALLLIALAQLAQLTRDRDLARQVQTLSEIARIQVAVGQQANALVESVIGGTARVRIEAVSGMANDPVTRVRTLPDAPGRH